MTRTLAVSLALIGLLASAAAPAQTCATIEPAVDDGVLVAPQNHEVLYETPDVRVIDVTVAPHTQEPMHTHARPAVLYVEQPGTGAMHYANASIVPNHFKTPFQPIAVWIPHEELHGLENTGDIPFHAIRVEFKHPGCSLPGEPIVTDPGPNDAVKIYPEGHRVLFDNADVRVLDVINAPHSREPFHTHLWPGFFYVVQAVPMRYSSQDGAPPILLGVPPIKIIPLPPNPMHSVENLGDKEAHFIRFELKHGAPPPPTSH